MTTDQHSRELASELIDTAQGTLRGLHVFGTRSGMASGENADSGVPVLCFRAVPYAAAPVGPLRFMPPGPCPAWKGVRDATRRGPAAPQPPSRLARVLGSCPMETSEDCLTLTVWTPAIASSEKNAPVPVLVWLHGGAFMTGGGDPDWHDGARLAREQGLVVVGVNYRLGALGFLWAEGVSSGNLGLMDQEAALEWVRRNIAAFGGDPARVTVMGQSAGAISIAHLLGRPTWWAQRAILCSAPMSLDPQSIDEAARPIGEAFLRALDIEPGAADALAKAQAAPLSAILAAQGAAARFCGMNATDPLSVEPPFIPVADGSFLDASEPFDVMLARASSRVDVMIGTTREKSMAFFAGDARLVALDPIPLSPEEIAWWRSRRPGASTLDVLVDHGTWDVFECGAVAWARQAAAAGRQAFLYRFDWSPAGSALAAAHCIELPFVFGTFAAFADAPMLQGGDAAQMEGISSAVRGAIGAFVRDADPARDGAPAWPPCSADTTVRMHWDLICEAQGVLASSLPSPGWSGSPA